MKHKEKSAGLSCLSRKSYRLLSILYILVLTTGICVSENKPNNPAYLIPANMVFVEGGDFAMGSTFSYDEKPVHKVHLDNFYLGKTEVTQGEWYAVMGNNPSLFRDETRPVEMVNWYDTVEFCNRLSKKEKLALVYTINKNSEDFNNTGSDYRKWTVTADFSANGYRLPTEAEWEFAARGGVKSREYTYCGSNDPDAVAWYRMNTGSTQPAAKKKANELGIYDMSGNVWEWCWDWYGLYNAEKADNPVGPAAGEYRVNRGGGWYDETMSIRSAKRIYGGIPDYRDQFLGFRLARSHQLHLPES